MYWLWDILNVRNAQFRSPDALNSLIGFVSGLGLLPFLLLLSGSNPSVLIVFCYSLGYSCLVLPLINIAFVSHDRSSQKCGGFENSSRAFFLGLVFALAVLLSLISIHSDHPKRLWAFSCYICLLSFFHWSEFYVTAVYNYANCGVDIYMLTHSPEYVMAVIACALEYWIETLCVPTMLPNYYYPFPLIVNIFGLLLCFGGEAVRKFAMITTAQNFNHYVETERRNEHQLVTSGVYSYFRHPAYVGWLYWTIGTQVLLGNPICLIGFTVVGYRFLYGRILHEERHLLYFFGHAYSQYQEKVGTGIPFIKGYRING
ncbi:unnamed protein product [Echinostoma caproni]|uniref:Protein-S-isoprenylcysteine O-methyltransferase n=1 Tax=Echinostoma caproni TaxID=27848 RepID=A0A183A232_9TREM|nr:unnamed protein product [Echinostoma caproni]